MEDPLAKYLPQDQHDQLTCFVLSDCSLYTLKAKKGRQEKECDFMHCSLSMGAQQIDLPDKKMNIPVIRISNDDYDED